MLLCNLRGTRVKPVAGDVLSSVYFYLFMMIFQSSYVLMKSGFYGDMPQIRIHAPPSPEHVPSPAPPDPASGTIRNGDGTQLGNKVDWRGQILLTAFCL
jgi:hypothetical protein